jgi:hypothetical protein
VFTSEFLTVLGGEKSEKYGLLLTNSFEMFKNLCIDCYMELRQNAEVFITMLNMMLCTGIPELNKNSISNYMTLNVLEFLNSSLALDMNDAEAERYLLKNLEIALNALSTKINFAIHILANK